MKINQLYPEGTKEMNQNRADLAPEVSETFRNFSREVFKEGALSKKTKQLIAVAVAHVTQCPYCIRKHTKQATKKGASKKEIMEAIWIAAEMRAGAALSHSMLAINEMETMNDAG